MAPLIVAEKLESLRTLLERIRARTPPSVEALREDIDAQESLVLNLARAVHSRCTATTTSTGASCTRSRRAR